MPDPNKILPPVMLAVALTLPPVFKLPPVIVPVADTVPPVAKLPPVIVAVAETRPPVDKLPLVVLPLTDKLVSTPTDVRLELTTPEFNVVPVKLLALTALAVTPVN